MVRMAVPEVILIRTVKVVTPRSKTNVTNVTIATNTGDHATVVIQVSGFLQI